ncbi:MAG: PAS domain S-box protein, partial [Alphaproteobacteria bacterium]|nr:PAS domain S-box protein [Alphaproteobacteria bacterium]
NAPASLLDAVLSNLFDAVVVVDCETGSFLGANQEVLELLGYTSQELQGLHPEDIHPHEIPRLHEFLREVRRNGRWLSGQLACRRKCGDLVPAEIRATFAVQDGREIIIIVIRDRRIDQLADLGRSIRKIAHDLRNTLATAQLLSDSLTRHGDHRVKRSAETITRAVERAVQMSRQALGSGRAGAPAPHHERFLLIDVVEEVGNSLGIGTESSALQCSESAASSILDADFDQIYRILLNLFRNALDAGAQTLRLDCERSQETLRITIADDGPGLPRKTIDELFGEKTGAGRPGHSGLGLMISRELAQNHGGDLGLVQTGPDGTSFELSLPVKAPTKSNEGRGA